MERKQYNCTLQEEQRRFIIKRKSVPGSSLSISAEKPLTQLEILTLQQRVNNLGGGNELVLQRSANGEIVGFRINRNYWTSE